MYTTFDCHCHTARRHRLHHATKTLRSKLFHRRSTLSYFYWSCWYKSGWEATAGIAVHILIDSTWLNPCSSLWNIGHRSLVLVFSFVLYSASEMTCTVSGGTLNSTHSAVLVSFCPYLLQISFPGVLWFGLWQWQPKVAQIRVHNNLPTTH